MTTTLAVLNEIARDMEAVSDADVRRAERNLAAARQGEAALGTIHNVAAHRVWALANTYEARGMEVALSAKFRANSEEESTALIQQAHRYAALEAMVREIFWTQAKEDIGGDSWSKKGGLGLRSGWMLVALPASPVDGLIAKIIGGAL
jgi:hypothetical protein